MYLRVHSSLVVVDYAVAEHEQYVLIDADQGGIQRTVDFALDLGEVHRVLDEGAVVGQSDLFCKHVPFASI